LTDKVAQFVKEMEEMNKVPDDLMGAYFKEK